jgi:hypothetical protein
LIKKRVCCACNKELITRLPLCHGHWKHVPGHLKTAILVNYREGQHIDKKPSAAYKAAKEAALKEISAKS